MKNKIEKMSGKKIISYIESTIYILSIIIVVFANVFGPIWVRMLPLLFMLGIIGKIIFNRPVVTTIFGGIVSICTIYLSGVTNIFENIIASGIFTLYIALGEFCGSKIEIIYGYLIKKKNIKTKEFTKCVIFSVAIVIVTTIFHNYTDSNLFLYNSCKNRLIKYLEENYPSEEFNIMYTRYNYKSENSFKFNIKELNTNNNYKFIVYIDKNLEIYDGIKKSEISKEEYKMNNEIKKIIGEKYQNISISLKNIDEEYELNLIKKVESIDKTQILYFSKEVAQIIDLLIENETINNVLYVNISLLDNSDSTNSKISTIYLSKYINNKEENIQQDYLYILNSLKIEYID